MRYADDVDSVQTSEEIVVKTVNTLQNLGNQVFALSPFSEHFSRWLKDLKVVLFEFESSSAIDVDDQFLKDRSQILSDIESKLEKLRSEEGSCEPLMKELSANRISLAKIEKEYATKRKEFVILKEAKTKALSGKVDSAKKELEQIERIRTGLFRGISKKAKAQKEKEATERVTLALAELSSGLKALDEQEGALRGEYEVQKSAIIDQISREEKEFECQDTDSSLQARSRACGELVRLIKEFLNRKNKLIWSF